MSIFATMMSSTERYRKQLEIIRKKYGPTNYVDQLKDVEILIGLEVDEDVKYEFERERVYLLAKIELEHLRTLSDVGETTIGVRGKDDKKSFEVERDGNIYNIKILTKHAILNDTIMYCLVKHKKIEDLNAEDYRNIGVRSCNDGENVRATLGRIMKTGLPVDVKHFFIMYIANLGFTAGILDQFPFLKIDHASAS